MIRSSKISLEWCTWSLTFSSTHKTTSTETFSSPDSLTSSMPTWPEDKLIKQPNLMTSISRNYKNCLKSGKRGLCLMRTSLRVCCFSWNIQRLNTWKSYVKDHNIQGPEKYLALTSTLMNSKRTVFKTVFLTLSQKKLLPKFTSTLSFGKTKRPMKWNPMWESTMGKQ